MNGKKTPMPATTIEDLRTAARMAVIALWRFGCEERPEYREVVCEYRQMIDEYIDALEKELAEKEGGE